jgi:hypothetical protein
MGFKPKMRERKLRRGVNRQGALKKERNKQRKKEKKKIKTNGRKTGTGCNYLPVGTAQHLRRSESSATPL